MATHKNAWVRYLTLDKCLRNTGRKYFWQNLLEECNKALAECCGQNSSISRRQLFYDINFLESEQGFSAPIERLKDGKQIYYRYEDKSFSINNQPLNETEVNQIKSALMIMSRFTGTPQFEWVSEIVPLLENKLGIVKQETPAISFESNVDLKGIHFLSAIFSAIVNKVVLKVEYKSFTDENPTLFVFHPHHLKQFNNRWFVFGLNQENKNPCWNLPLDRIEKISETKDKYIDSNIVWDDYFFDIIGVTRHANDKPQEIVLEFLPEQAPYITTKPLHPTQKNKLTDEGLIVRIKVIPNYELIKLILSFGEMVRVIKPKELKETIKQKLSNAVVRYNE
jgi:predicted DNA-binding transcriptional regulator YafY